ncbi:hypothetical protein D5045_06380 [Verminephrobacter eiseniae]|nr:hypothetical protein [Verminephrobacter eiseniae]
MKESNCSDSIRGDARAAPLGCLWAIAAQAILLKSIVDLARLHGHIGILNDLRTACLAEGGNWGVAPSKLIYLLVMSTIGDLVDPLFSGWPVFGVPSNEAVLLLANIDEASISTATRSK